MRGRCIGRGPRGRSIGPPGGSSTLLLVALRADPEGRAAVVAALLDEEALAQALETAGALQGPIDDVRALARDVLDAL